MTMTPTFPREDPPIPAPPPRTSPPLVLVADDDKLTRTLLGRSLQEDGYRVHLANDGVDCLEQFRLERPALALVDAMMPRMDGFDCCQALLAEPGAANLPVLMITGLEDLASVDRAFEVGAIDYVSKPIRWPVLRHRLRLLMAQIEQQQAMEADQRALQKLVMTDTLTKLANRRRFDEELAKEWRRSIREDNSLSLIMIDIDSFKPYNDYYGHPQGDRCLQEVALALAENVHRGGDVTARYGGEEFGVILPNTHGPGAFHVAERIRQAVWNLKIPHGHGRRSEVSGALLRERVTVSLGVATLFPRADVSPTMLIKLADEALYQAKAQGGNTTVFLNLAIQNAIAS